MADTKAETIARLESFGPTTPYKRSDPFKIGIWTFMQTQLNSLLSDPYYISLTSQLQGGEGSSIWPNDFLADYKKLEKLKKGCLMYLLDFGKIYDVREETNDFFRQADRELVVEMFQELLAVWKPT